MPYSRIRENTASLWMTKDSTRAQYPTDGQGGIANTSSQSLFADAGPSRPIIIEAVLCEWNISGSDIFVNIRDLNAVEIFSLRVKSTGTTASDKVSSYTSVGGPYGVRVEQPVLVRINSSGISPIGGLNTVGLVHIFFRYA